MPHSVHPWAAAQPPYTAMRDPFPDPIWSNYARARRRGGGIAAPLLRPWALYVQKLLVDPILSPVQADLGR